MRRTSIYGVVGYGIGIQRTARKLDEMTLRYFHQIWLSAGTIERAAFPQVQILKAHMSKAALYLDKTV